MDIIQQLLKDIPLPKMLKVRQTFDDEQLDNAGEELQALLQEERENTPDC